MSENFDSPSIDGEDFDISGPSIVSPTALTCRLMRAWMFLIARRSLPEFEHVTIPG